MKPNILALVSEIASLSSGARRIADRVVAVSGTEQFAAVASADTETAVAVATAELRQKLADLERHAQELSEALDDADDVVMDDGQRAVFRTQFADRLKTTPLPQLANSYDHAYFRAQPRSLRPIIASILTGMFDERNVLPPSLWQKLALSDGTM